ncbi:hypothetical protein [Vibrio cyclitrophicus]|uniref:hypothetical protein n=1 Tax=Vibrio cyclitrophicus TaxID=47951 RepID=UPI0011131B81|nr:hypothetical protein [Vibrio cyclitrophicus]
MDDNGNISIKNALKFCELQAMNGGQTLLRRKYKYLLKSEGDELGEVKLTNPIAIGEVIKIVSKPYRIADIWHSEVVSVAYVERID